jgi:hypothetical protein
LSQIEETSFANAQLVEIHILSLIKVLDEILYSGEITYVGIKVDIVISGWIDIFDNEWFHNYSKLQLIPLEGDSRLHKLGSHSLFESYISPIFPTQNHILS